MERYGAKNQLCAKHQKKMMKNLVYKDLVFSRVREVSGIDPIQDILAAMEIGYFDPSFIPSSKILVSSIYLVTSFVLSLIHLFHDVVCLPLSSCFERGTAQASEDAALKIHVLCLED